MDPDVYVGVVGEHSNNAEGGSRGLLEWLEKKM